MLCTVLYSQPYHCFFLLAHIVTRVMFSLYRVEQSVYALLRTRDMAISRYKEFGIPVNWLMDSGVVGKVCFKNVELVCVMVITRVGSSKCWFLSLTVVHTILNITVILPVCYKIVSWCRVI